MNYQDPALELMSQECVGASPLEVNPEEKDSLDFELANSTKETSAQVQVGSGAKILCTIDNTGLSSIKFYTNNRSRQCQRLVVYPLPVFPSVCIRTDTYTYERIPTC